MSGLPKGKPILCVDFDGVIHSYKSGWKGPRCIPDWPVPGALEWLWRATKAFDVQIYSSRSRYFGGRRAMKKWLKTWYRVDCALPSAKKVGSWQFSFIAETAFADPWEEEIEFAIRNLLRKIKFPTEKPAAFLSIDDRGYRFTGEFPVLEELLLFKPWNKK